MAICPVCMTHADPGDEATVRTVGADFHRPCHASIRGKATGKAPVVLRPEGEPLPGPAAPREPKGVPEPREDYAARADRLDRRGWHVRMRAKDKASDGRGSY
jgi:hypothetical protein